MLGHPDAVVWGKRTVRSVRLMVGAIMAFVACLVAFAAGSPAVDAAVAEVDTVEGTLADWDGTPFAGATIDLFERQGSGNERGQFLGFGRTGDDGRVTFDVSEGCYVLIFIAPEGRAFTVGQYERAVVCTEQGNNSAGFLLAAGDDSRTSAIGGTVTNADGTPATPSLVVFHQAGADGSRSTWIGSLFTRNGSYEYDVPPGCYILDFAPPEGGRFDRQLWYQTGACVEAGETLTDVSAQLDPITNTALGGSVRDDANRPVSGAQVDLFVECCGQGTRSDYLGSTRTDPSGQYILRLEEGGCYALVFVAPDGYSYDGERYRELRTCVETGSGMGGLSVRALADSRVSQLSGQVFYSTNVRGSVRASLWTAAQDGSRLDYVRRVDPNFNDGTFRELVGAGCHWLVFEAPEDGSFEGDRTKEVFTCVDAFDEVTDLHVEVSDAEGQVYTRASLGDVPPITEPDDEPIFVPVPIRLERAWEQPVTVFYAVMTNGSDGFPREEQATQELVFAPGEIEKNIQVKVYGDTLYRPEPGRIEIDFSELGPTGLMTFYLGTRLFVLEDDPRSPLRVVVADQAAYEENADHGAGRGVWRMTIELEHENRNLEQNEWVTVPWELRDGSATVADGDYVAQSGEVTLGYNRRRLEVLIEVPGDDRVEPDETLQLVLLPPTAGEALIGAPGTFTILDDDDSVASAGSVSLSRSTVEVTEGRSAEIGVVFDDAADVQRAVDIVLRDGTATEADGDYQPVTRTVWVPAGAAGRYFAYNVLDDDVTEPTENFFIELANPSPGLAVTVGSTEVVIIDND